MPFNVSVAAPLLQCIDGCSTFSGAMGICCGEDGGNLYCYGANCRCTNSTPGGATCSCRPGFQGASCMQQIEPETTWLAVILTVGTMLILFIAWGFRCRPDDFDEDDDGQANTRAAARNPLIREQMDNVVAAASPPTPRGSHCRTTADSSATGGDGDEEPIQNRLCCVCLDKRIQVVVIPCGHACMCRKCSFRVTKCPVCRLDIQAQQRFYM